MFSDRSIAVILLLSTVLMVLALATEVWLVWHVRNDILKAKKAVRDFLSASAEGLSPLAMTVLGLVPGITAAMKESAKMSIKGQISGMVRSMNAAEGEAAEEVMGADPVKAALASAFRRQMKKNPMLAFALDKVMPGNNHNGNHGGPPAGGSSQSKLGF